ncbi:MAG: TonB-dependent receptor plug domain-containing protein [Odoribacter sp.]|nr:TonB-dependent receptor plug domain-containing protein [Odoribacter sp.]
MLKQVKTGLGICIALCAGMQVRAQQKDSIAMYGVIDTVHIVSRRVQYANEANAGARVSRIDPEVLQENKTRSLAELLTEHTTIYIKSLGMGALSTASFRGASPSETRVNWNGINITPPMSGTFDFSQIPVFFTDNINLYYGGSHGKNGTGAIGGSVNLFTTPDWHKGVTGKVLGEYGSYGTCTVGAQVKAGGQKSSFKTRLYYQHSDNDYTYVNKVLTNDPFREKRRDADYTQWSAMQEGYFRLSPDVRLTAIAWYQEGERMLPPALGVVNQTHEKQRETNVRGYLGLDFTRRIHDLQVKTAGQFYRQKYDKWYAGGMFDPEGNKNQSQTWQGIVNYTCTPLQNLILGSSLTYSHDWIRVSSYIDIDSSKYILEDVDYDIPVVEPPFCHPRNVLSWQVSAMWKPVKRLSLNGQYLFERNDRRNVSTWSAGLVCYPYERDLQVKGSVAYNYRFPSMNDLYWRPGGNPDVKPEKGYSYDVAVAYRKQLCRGLSLDAEVAGYLMYIDDWILWLPKDGNQWVWTPQNHRNVRSEGVELFGKLTYEIGDLRVGVSGNYNWSQSRTRKKRHEDDGSFMKQIPYVPRFKWNTRGTADYRGAFCSWQVTYIGRRFITTDQEYATDPYSVQNLQAGYRHKFGNGMCLTPSVRVDNLLDAYYESTQYYPMPLRNCLFSVILEF